jgi:hypothetical protein
MPKGPQGQKRPADVVGAAVIVAKIDEDIGQHDGKDPAAKALGKKGGAARAAKNEQKNYRPNNAAKSQALPLDRGGMKRHRCRRPLTPER